MEEDGVRGYEPIIETERDWITGRAGGNAEAGLHVLPKKSHGGKIALWTDRQPDKTLPLIRQEAIDAPRKPATLRISAGNDLVQPARNAARRASQSKSPDKHPGHDQQNEELYPRQFIGDRSPCGRR